MQAYSIAFDGRVLDRGFWIYVIDVDSPSGRVLYVGRTGDSSSANASSPFSRIGQHLDCRPNAKGNALARNLRNEGIEPGDCRMEMIAIGPIFPEEKQFDAHRPVRDRVAALESGVAKALTSRGYRVLGKHASAIQADPEALSTIIGLVEKRLNEREQRN